MRHKQNRELLIKTTSGQKLHRAPLSSNCPSLESSQSCFSDLNVCNDQLLHVINKLTCFKLSFSCIFLSICRIVDLCVSLGYVPPTRTCLTPLSLHLPFVAYLQHSTQPDDNLLQLETACHGDNTVNEDDNGVEESYRGKTCEDDDEEGHLVYHVGLVLKERCT